MTTPAPPPQHPVPPPPVAADASALIPVILSVVAAYLALKGGAAILLTHPWRTVAAALRIPALAGGALDALARRALDRQRRDSVERTGDELWQYNEQAVKTGVDAGVQGLVQVVRDVAGRKVRLPTLAPGSVVVQDLALAPAPHPMTAPTPHPFGAGAIPEPQSFQLSTLPQAPPDNYPPPTPLNPASLHATALDLVDAVVNATTNGSAELASWTKTWRTQGDDKVRASHRLLDGITISATEAFQTDAGPLRFPHDPEAAYGEIVNCRCHLTFSKEVIRG